MGLVACKSEPRAEDAPAPAAPATAQNDADAVGVPECDEYLTALTACVEKMPPEAKAAMQQGLEKSKEAWRKAAAAGGKDALKPGCQAALDALKQNPACQ